MPRTRLITLFWILTVSIYDARVFAADKKLESIWVEKAATSVKSSEVESTVNNRQNSKSFLEAPKIKYRSYIPSEPRNLMNIAKHGEDSFASAQENTPQELSIASDFHSMRWTGLYLGGNVGVARSRVASIDVGNGARAFADLGSSGQNFNAVRTNGLVGFQGGYSQQFNQWLAGIEIDIGILGFTGQQLEPNSTSATYVGIRNGLYGDITGRFGILLNRSLFYTKAGWAFFTGKEAFSTSSHYNVGNSVGIFSGWTVGGGYEYRFSQNWSIKLEYQHFDFGSQTFNLTPNSWLFREKLTADTVKFGINYFIR